jgi:two-component sensor histidine kinase
MEHRVANSLQIIASILMLKARIAAAGRPAAPVSIREGRTLPATNGR